jgi:hypothetical protein
VIVREGAICHRLEEEREVPERTEDITAVAACSEITTHLRFRGERGGGLPSGQVGADQACSRCR